MKSKKKVTKQKVAKVLNKQFPTKLLVGIGILFISLFIIVIYSNQQQALTGEAQTAITPTFGAIGDCQTMGTCPTGSTAPSGVAVTGKVPVITNNPSPTNPSVSGNPVSPTINPCTSTQSEQVTAFAQHRKKGNNNSSGFLQAILQFFLKLLQLLQQLLGGNGNPPVVNPPVPTQAIEPTQAQQPTQAMQPTVAQQPTTAPMPSQAPCPPTNAPQPTTPQTQPTSVPSNVPSSVPQPTTSAAACVTSDPNGFCPAAGQHYNDPNIYGNNNNIYVANNIAFPIAGATETLTAFGAENWNAVATVPAGNTSVVTAPQTRIDYLTNNTPGPRRLSKSRW